MVKLNEEVSTDKLVANYADLVKHIKALHRGLSKGAEAQGMLSKNAKDQLYSLNSVVGLAIKEYNILTKMAGITGKRAEAEEIVNKKLYTRQGIRREIERLDRLKVGTQGEEIHKLRRIVDLEERSYQLALAKTNEFKLHSDQEARLLNSKRRLKELEESRLQISKKQTRDQRLQAMATEPGDGLFSLQGRLLANYATWSTAIRFARMLTTDVVQLDASFRQLQAITAITDTQLGGLSKRILEISRATKFTGQEVAEAAIILGQAGYTTQEIGDTLDAVTRLATATGTDIASTVALVTSALEIYNLNTSQAADVTDKLTVAINTTKLTLDKIQSGMQYVGNIAAEMGVSFDETVAAMGAAAQAGIRTASMFGTGLRAMLGRLAAPTERTKQVFREVGLTMADVDVQTLGLTQVMRNLSESTMTVGQAMEAFDRRGGAFYMAVSRNVEVMERMQLNMLQTGAATEANESQMKSLSNTLLKLRAAVSNLAFEGFKPLMALLQKTAYGVAFLVEKFTDFLNFSPFIKGVVTTALALTAAIQGVTFAVAALMKVTAGIKALTIGYTAGLKLLTAATEADTVATTTNTAVKIKLTSLSEVWAYWMGKKTALLKILTASTWTWTTSLKAAKVAMLGLLASSGPFLLLAGAIWGVSKAYNYFTGEQERLRTAAQEASAAADTQVQSYENLTKKMTAYVKRGVVEGNQLLLARTEIENSLRREGVLVDKVAESWEELYDIQIKGLEKVGKMSLNSLTVAQGSATQAYLGKLEKTNLSRNLRPEEVGAELAKAQASLNSLEVKRIQGGLSVDTTWLKNLNRDIRKQKTLVKDLESVSKEAAVVVDLSLKREAFLKEQDIRDKKGGLAVEAMGAFQKTLGGLTGDDSTANALAASEAFSKLVTQIGDLKENVPEAAEYVGQAREQAKHLLDVLASDVRANARSIEQRMTQFAKNLDSGTKTEDEIKKTWTEIQAEVTGLKTTLGILAGSELLDEASRETFKNEQVRITETLENTKDRTTKSLTNLTLAISELQDSFKGLLTSIEESTQSYNKQMSDLEHSRRRLEIRGKQPGADPYGIASEQIGLDNKEALILDERLKTLKGQLLELTSKDLNTQRQIRDATQAELDSLQQGVTTQHDITVLTKKRDDAAKTVSETEKVILENKEEQLKIEERLAELSEQEERKALEADRGANVRRNIVMLNREWLKQNEVLISTGVLVRQLWGATLSSLESGMSSFIQTTTDGTKSIGQAFKDMALSILQSLHKIAADMAAKGLMGMFTQMGLSLIGGSSVPSGTAAPNPGPVTVTDLAPIARSKGGPVPGADLGRDSVHAMLRPGEWVLQKSAVDVLGKDFLGKLNQGQVPMAPVPMFNKGQDGQMSVTNVYVVERAQMPTLSANDVLVTIGEDIRNNGTTKQLIKSVVTGGKG